MKMKMEKLLAIFAVTIVIVASFNSIVYGDKENKLGVNRSNRNILYVGGTGPNNYTRIQDAIDNASDGDTIFVYSGIYYEM